MVHRCFMLLFYHQEIFPPTGRIQGEFPEFLDVHRFFTIYQIFMVIFLEFFMYLPGHNSKYEKREEFLAHFEKNPTKTNIGFVVLGGVFSEGIDLIDDRLIGAIIIGVGL